MCVCANEGESVSVCVCVCVCGCVWVYKACDSVQRVGCGMHDAAQSLLVTYWLGNTALKQS
jgi:hypothetical protein